jgi:PAT family beta-lactamase induction signal transducer AmpG
MGEPSGQPADQPLPARRKHNPADLAWVMPTNFGEGLPWSFIHQMGTDYLTAIRAPIAQVGYTSWLHLAVTLKFLWSPLVDLAGKKRTWMVAMQVLLGAGMLGVAAISRGGTGTLGTFWLALAVLSIVHATHDIACDGYYLIKLNRADQALYVGPRVLAFKLATLTGSSILIAVAGARSWPVAFAIAAIIMTAIGLINTAFVPRVNEASQVRAPQIGVAERARNFWEAYRTFFNQPRIVPVLLFILTLKLGDIMMFSMARPLLRDIGVGTEQRGWLGTPTQICSIAGAVLAGAMLARWGIQRMLVPIIYFMNLAIPLYAVLAWTAPPFWVVATLVCIEQFAGGMGQTAQQVFLMQRARRAFSASHYAFATALTALGTTISGAFSGHLYGAVGMRWYFIVCFGFGLPSMILALVVPKTAVDEPGPSGQ